MSAPPTINWSGVMPAITTPFTDDGSIDHTAVAERIERAIDGGVTGIVPAGSLGEGATLSTEEKRALFSTCVEAARGRVPVVAAIAAAATFDAITLAQLASEAGCQGLMILPPYVHHGAPREVMAHFESIFTATRAPCMLYNNPIAYGADLRAPQIALLAERFPHLEAVKESSGDVRRITELKHALGDRLALFVGLDDLLVEGVRAGAVGWIAGLVNAFPPESVRLFEMARDGDPAVDALYRWFLPLLRLDVVPDFVERIKQVEAALGLGSSRVRAPRLPLREEDRAEIAAVVAAAIETAPLDSLRSSNKTQDSI